MCVSDLAAIDVWYIFWDRALIPVIRKGLSYSLVRFCYRTT